MVDSLIFLKGNSFSLCSLLSVHALTSSMRGAATPAIGTTGATGLLPLSITFSSVFAFASAATFILLLFFLLLLELILVDFLDKLVDLCFVDKILLPVGDVAIVLLEVVEVLLDLQLVD